MSSTRSIRAARNLSATAVATIAAWSSYYHILHVALRYGERPEVAYGLPASVDGMLVVATIVMVDDKRHGRPVRPLARLAFTVGVIASVAANIAAAQPTIGARVIDAWPAIALLLVVEMLARGPAPTGDATAEPAAPVSTAAAAQPAVPAERVAAVSAEPAVPGFAAATVPPSARPAEPAALPAEHRTVPMAATTDVPPLPATAAVPPPAAAEVPSRRCVESDSRHLRSIGGPASSPCADDVRAAPSARMDGRSGVLRPVAARLTVPPGRPIDESTAVLRLAEAPAAHRPVGVSAAIRRRDDLPEVPPANRRSPAAEPPSAAAGGGSVMQPPAAEAATGGNAAEVPPVAAGRRPAAVTRHLAYTILQAEPDLSRTELARRVGLSPRRLREVLAA